MLVTFLCKIKSKRDCEVMDCFAGYPRILHLDRVANAIRNKTFFFTFCWTLCAIVLLLFTKNRFPAINNSN